MGKVVNSSTVDVRSSLAGDQLVLTDEEMKTRVLLLVFYHPTAPLGCWFCRALALPVESPVINEVIMILVCLLLTLLVQCDQKELVGMILGTHMACLPVALVKHKSEELRYLSSLERIV